MFIKLYVILYWIKEWFLDEIPTFVSMLIYSAFRSLFIAGGGMLGAYLANGMVLTDRMYDLASYIFIGSFASMLTSRPIWNDLRRD